MSVKTKRIKKTYRKGELPKVIQHDFDQASAHLSACWMLMSTVMVHLDKAEDLVRRWGEYKFDVKYSIETINHHFKKLDDWYRKMASECEEGLELFNREYAGATSALNKILGFNECGEYVEKKEEQE